MAQAVSWYVLMSVGSHSSVVIKGPIDGLRISMRCHDELEPSHRNILCSSCRKAGCLASCPADVGGLCTRKPCLFFETLHCGGRWKHVSGRIGIYRAMVRVDNQRCTPSCTSVPQVLSPAGFNWDEGRKGGRSREVVEV